MYQINFNSTRPLASCKLFLFGALFLATSLCVPHARPANAAESDYTRLSKGIQANAATGLATAKAFLAQDTTMPLAIRAFLERQMALAYFNDLKDPKSALEVLDTGMAEVDKAPAGPAQDFSRSALVIARARIETSQGQYQQAATLIDSNLPVMLSIKGDRTVLREGLLIDAQALGSLQQKPKLVPHLQEALLSHPEFMGDFWVMGQLVNNMVAEGNSAAALGYAKLTWMLCPFDMKSLQNATNLMTSTWLAAELNAGKGNAFIAAQTNSTLENPLTAVKLPVLDDTALNAGLADIPAADIHNRITILLAQGKMGDAMLMARRNLLDHPSGDNSETILEMARVFKAADLNLVRANAFVQYFQTGKGTNPLDDFFKQYPAETTAAAK